MARFPNLLCALALVAATPTVAAQGFCLNTINPFANNNSGSAGGAVFFDLSVSGSVLVQSLNMNFTATASTAVGVDVYVTPGTAFGNESNAAVWTMVGTDNGTATAAGLNAVTSVPLQSPVLLAAGNYGVALVAKGSGHAYTNGNGTNQTYSDSFLTINLGTAQNVPFTGTPFSPRVWNGAICYLPASGLFPNFDATPKSGNAPLNVQFTDLTYTSDPGGVLGWNWDVDGDGQVDYSSPNPSHTYATEGYYNVSLSVVDGTHGIQTVTKNAFIAVDVVDASFTFSLTGASSVQFTDTSAGHPTGWAWDFDNNGTVDSNLQNPTHTYAAPGSYTCKLTVSDAISTDDVTVTIGVSVLPISPFASTFTSASATRGFYFQAPRRFSIVSLKVPDESAHGLQNVAVYRFNAAPPQYSATVQGTPEFFSAGQPSAAPLPCALSFDAGEFVGILGACGDASTMRNSYGAGNFASSIFGQPTTLLRMLTQTNIVANSGVCNISAEGTASIARVEVGISAATGLPYGAGTASGSGAPAPVLKTTALPRMGTTARLTIENGDAGAIGFAFVGFGRLNLPTPFGTILVNNIAVGIPMNGGSPLPVGATNFPFAIPNTPSLNGAGPIDWQAVCAVPGSPNGVSMSNGQEWFLAF